MCIDTVKGAWSQWRKGERVMTSKARLMIAASALACLITMGCAGKAAAPATATSALDPAYLAAHVCGKPGDAAPTSDKAMPLLGGLAPIHYAVSSKNPEVQLYFDQGIALLYGFEYETAYKSFKMAKTLDPNCAMCGWGMAMALGPNINNSDMKAKDLDEARALLATATKATDLTDRDRALIDALNIRYAAGAPSATGNVWTEKFADAMGAAAQRWPDDDFVTVLAAESAMDMRPWDYWEPGGHVAKPWGAKAMTLVEAVLKRNPDQAEAMHLYIHLTEDSDNPRRAEPYADRLGALAPNSPHLVHMPSHTFYPLGRFKDSIVVNEKAIALDEGMARDIGADPAWYGYYFHHARFIMSAAQQVGDGPTALRLAAQMEQGVPLDKALTSEWAESTLALTLQARGQFQTPAEVLALAAPDKRLKIATVAWRAVRAEAFARAGDVVSARKELKALKKARDGAKSKDWKGFVDLANEMALGRVELAAGNNAAAIAHFRTAVTLDSQFEYAEPPLWFQPADIALGRALLASGDAAGAKAAFDHAIAVRPGNAYAVWGQAQAEAKLGDTASSQAATAAFDGIWLGDTGTMTMDRL